MSGIAAEWFPPHGATAAIHTAITPRRTNKSRGSSANDLRNAGLSLHTGATARTDPALRHHHAEALGKARHQAGRLFHHADRHSNQELTYLLAWESMAEREIKWNAFATDPAWLSARAETEKDGQIVDNITNQFLQPTAFSPVK
jgi:hypothetical protein